VRRSHHISGVGALLLLAAPILGAAIWSEDSLDFVRQTEKRPPAAWPAFSAPGDLIDADTWRQADRAIGDRIPWRAALVRTKVGIETRVLGDRLLGVPGEEKVGLGRDGWLFYLDSLGAMTGDSEQVARALAAAESAAASEDWRARLILVPAPDKASLYPEQLSRPLKRMLEPHAGNRGAIRDWFRQPGLPDRVDTWAYFKRAQASSEKPLYEPTGSHHSSFGSMVLAHAMLDAIDPSLWEPNLITHRATVRYQSGLSTLAGFFDRIESWERFEIVRPGIETEAFIHDGNLIPNADRAPNGPGANDLPARYINRSAGPPLVDGRTLIVHDSFIAGYLRPTLSRFFSDVTFIHYRLITPGDLQDALRDYDLVVLEFVERSARQTLQGFFSKREPAGKDAIRRRVSLPVERRAAPNGQPPP